MTDDESLLPESIQQRRAHQRKLLQILADRGVDVSLDVEALRKSHAEEFAQFEIGRKHLEYHDSVIRGDDTITLGRMITEIAEAMNDEYVFKDWFDCVSKRVRRATQRKKDRLVTNHNNRVTIRDAASFVNKHYHIAPWRYVEPVTTGLSCRFKTNEKASIADLITRQDNLNAAKAEARREKEKALRLVSRIHELEAENKNLTDRLSRKGTGRPKGKPKN
jgi:hypothetical protein